MLKKLSEQSWLVLFLTLTITAALPMRAQAIFQRRVVVSHGQAQEHFLLQTNRVDRGVATPVQRDITFNFTHTPPKVISNFVLTMDDFGTVTLVSGKQMSGEATALYASPPVISGENWQTTVNFVTIGLPDLEEGILDAQLHGGILNVNLGHIDRPADIQFTADLRPTSGESALIQGTLDTLLGSRVLPTTLTLDFAAAGYHPSRTSITTADIAVRRILPENPLNEEQIKDLDRLVRWFTF